jgi:hypothetical protein
MLRVSADFLNKVSTAAGTMMNVKWKGTGTTQ